MKQSMRKKNALFLVCLILVSLMIGCNRNPETAVPTEPAVPDSPAAPDILADPSQWPKVEAYAGVPLLEADPNRDVYIGLANQDCDFYAGPVTTGIFFVVLTKKAYSTNDIKVEFPGKTHCEVRVSEYNSVFQNIGEHTVDGQQLYHYLCMQDIDLKAWAQRNSDEVYADKALSALTENNLPVNEKLATFIEDTATAEGISYTKYREQYRDQPQGSITDYNAYLVNLNFRPKRYVDETVEYIDITIGAEKYRVEFGQWRFHNEDWPEADQNPKGIVPRQLFGVFAAPDDSPYAEGYLHTPDGFQFNTLEDILLTGIRCSEGTDAQAIGAKLACTAGLSDTTIFWDGVTPLKVEAASKVSASVYLYSEKFKEYEMNMTTTIYLDYELVSTGEKCTFAMQYHFPRSNNVWDTYCLAFLGIDVGEYYHYFSEEMIGVGWLRELPESWRVD